MVAAGALAYLLPRLLGPRRRGAARAERRARARRAPEPSPPRAFWSSPRGLEWLLLGARWRCTRCRRIYSSDPPRRPRTSRSSTCRSRLLFVLLRDVRWTRELLLRCLGVAVALAVLFAGVGFVEYSRKSLFLNPKVVAANQYDNYFRVNSVFFDPSIYGRFLALVMIAVTTRRCWWTRRARAATCWSARPCSRGCWRGW